MSQVLVCDQGNCKEIISGGTIEREFEIVTDDGTLKILLNEEKDWCPACARKAKNRLAMAANNELRKPRIKK